MALTVPPLCIVQARYHSHRLPGKMLLPLGGETLAARGWRLACEAFGAENCVVAIMENDVTMFGELVRIGATIFEYTGDEADVLGRFHACAHAYRWHPNSILHRWTSDDPFKVPEACRRVANGERLPVEIGGEAFTLAMLDEAHEEYRHAGDITADPTSLAYEYALCREHITHAIPALRNPPAAPAGQVWTVDTKSDLIAARERWARENGHAMVEA